MFNFLAAADENPWLAELDLAVLNARLEAKRRAFEALRASGEFWKMGKEEREHAGLVTQGVSGSHRTPSHPLPDPGQPLRTH